MGLRSPVRGTLTIVGLLHQAKHLTKLPVRASGALPTLLYQCGTDTESVIGPRPHYSVPKLGRRAVGKALRLLGNPATTNIL